MPWLLNVCYLILLVFLSPWLLYKALTTGKYRRGLRAKLLGSDHSTFRTPHSAFRPIWFHGVSVGEIHLLRQVIAAFRQRQPDRTVVLSTTTDTGYDEAKRCFPDLEVIYFPLDFSWAVRRTLRGINPALIVLAENELWPSFLMAARQLGVRVALVNGRMSPRSFRRWRRLRFVSRWLLGQLDLLAVQTQAYADSFIDLGAPAHRVHITGSVKYDGVTTDRHNARTAELRRQFNIGPDDLVWIAGSTQAPEEEIAIGIYQRLRPSFPNLRLFLVPRQKDRFDEVARLLERSKEAFLRRSVSQSAIGNLQSAIVLMDTIGELGALWGLADVAFVGGSLDGHRGGQNMIEPAAYGAAVVFGPHVWNFQDAANRLLDVQGACQVSDARELEQVIRRLLADTAERQRRGTAAQRFVIAQQGATGRTLDLLDQLLPDPKATSQAA